MRNTLSVQEHFYSIRNRLKNYIKSDYLANSETLLLYTDDLLGETSSSYTNIASEPFIETSASYKKIANGIAISSIIDHATQCSLQKMISHNLGVFNDPYEHQIYSLEKFLLGRDLFVSTGTGSGKTECFLWPIITKCFEEALNRPNDFKNPSVRTLIIYPMNALVSDQLARFRKVFGSERYMEIFTTDTHSTRIPHFGMYTGRTPYSGDAKSSSNRELAITYRENYLIDSKASSNIQKQQKDSIEGLKSIYKYPARYGENGITNFVSNLERNIHNPSPYDAEFITRFEMQNNPPDILITNYSMLEYMLMRQRESGIWDKTTSWLNASAENKLLVVLDEAHMYRGSTGGEIALLLERLLHRLKISQDKVQYILTSASIPHDNQECINEFYTGLTNKKPTHCEFIFGKKNPNSINIEVPTQIEILTSIGSSQVCDEAITTRIKKSLLLCSMLNCRILPKVTPKNGYMIIYHDMKHSIHFKK